MYNKLFTKILDSSIWLEPDSTRLVWLTLLAAMDQDGFAQFASAANLAHRARVSADKTAAAIKALESPDDNSSDQDHEGRRIERVPGGWVILNAAKYQELVTRAITRQRTKERVRKHREKHAKTTNVTPSNDVLRSANGRVTPSDTDADAHSDADAHADSLGDARTNRALAPRTVKRQSLIDGSSQRIHGLHAWCDLDRGMCVPVGIHSEFKARLGASDADARLMAWYPTVVLKYAGQPIGDSVFEFWRNELAAWQGSVTSRPARRRKARALEPQTRLMRRMRR